MGGDVSYPEGVLLFQGEKFFEAHEVLEHVWRATPPGERRQFLQGLIQLAVSLEHWRRGNPRGARGQYEKARAKLDPLPTAFDGLDLAALLADVGEFYERQDLFGTPRPDRALPWPRPRWIYSLDELDPSDPPV